MAKIRVRAMARAEGSRPERRLLTRHGPEMENSASTEGQHPPEQSQLPQRRGKLEDPSA
ncbi:MAG: hypothetical protein ACK6AD_03005 [Cyanobacteriota bacterium]